ncbi:MAG: hypothetical protein H6712_11420 [Myxococcales bacterium]|nr:hypothetical protein [Myxococcales bacterium]
MGIQRIVPEIVEHAGIPWADQALGFKVFIRPSGSYEQIKDLIPTELASRVRETVGIIVDADVSVEGRWRSLRDHCSSTVVGLSPEQWPAAPVSEGLVIDFEAPQGHRRLGLWIMPDNRAPGMIETFLQPAS